MHQLEKMNKVLEVKYDLDWELGREADAGEIAVRVDLTIEKVKELLRNSKTCVFSYQAPLKADGESGQQHVELIEDTGVTNREDQAALQHMKEAVARLLKVVEPREKQILELRFGIGNVEPMTLDEIGKILNLSRERIRQLEAIALRKLRDVPISQLRKYLS